MTSTVVMLHLLLIVILILGVGHAGAEQVCNTKDFPLSTPTERFQDNGDGTVTDSVSGLMWMRCPLGQVWSDSQCRGTLATYDWPAAHQAAEDVNASGDYFFSDWRVPSLRDLAQITERQCDDPRINLAIFPGTPAAFFWTSTPRPGEDTDDVAYALSFGPEGVKYRPRVERHFLRLVRTAQ
jgi:hypothetical protein